MTSTETHPPTSHPQASISRSTAVKLIDAVRAAAKDIGFEVAVAVTDAGGHLRAFERSDATPFLAAGVAIDKAWTASASHFPTHVWNQLVADPQNAPLANVPRLVAAAGGYPVVEGGVVIGGLGVSGGSADQDQQAAETGLTSLGLAPAA